MNYNGIKFNFTILKSRTTSEGIFPFYFIIFTMFSRIKVSFSYKLEFLCPVFWGHYLLSTISPIIFCLNNTLPKLSQRLAFRSVLSNRNTMFNTYVISNFSSTYILKNKKRNYFNNTFNLSQNTVILTQSI